jgi:Ca2+-binding EF-hand superfamily protein
MSDIQNPYLLTLPQLISAKQKVGKVACFYDPRKTSLKCFDSEGLNATQFREQLKRNLCVRLTDDELGALILLFDKNNDKTVGSVEFVNEFLKLREIERTKLKMAKKDVEDYIIKRKDKHEQERIKTFERLSYSRWPDTHTAAEEESAVKKVANIAFTYDAMKGGLEGFYSAKSMTGQELREQLYRNFELFLTPEEGHALSELFDTDGNGEVDCKEFCYHFFRIGRAEKDRHSTQKKIQTQKLLKIEEERRKDIQRKFVEKTVFVMTSHTEDEMKSAYDKIKQAAFFYKKGAFINNFQKSFESQTVTPTVFRELLKQNFEIVCSPGEMHAMMKLFDDNDDGAISCAEFMSNFFRIGGTERSKALKEKIRMDRLLNEKKVQLHKEKELMYKERVKTSVVYPILPQDDSDDEEEDSLAMSSASNVRPSTTMSMGGSSKFSMSSRRPSRKGISMAELLSPIRKTLKEQNISAMKKLVDKFPKASEDTKNFLLDLEKQEHEMKILDKKTRPQSRSPKSFLLKDSPKKHKKQINNNSLFDDDRGED